MIPDLNFGLGGLLILLLKLFFDAVDLGDDGLELANRALVL